VARKASASAASVLRLGTNAVRRAPPLPAERMRTYTSEKAMRSSMFTLSAAMRPASQLHEVFFQKRVAARWLSHQALLHRELRGH